MRNAGAYPFYYQCREQLFYLEEGMPGMNLKVLGGLARWVSWAFARGELPASRTGLEGLRGWLPARP